MSKRYAIEIRLIEVDDAGKEVEEVSVVTKAAVSDSFGSMEASMEWLSDCLGNAMFDHLTEGEILTDRYSGLVVDRYESDEEESE